jgi:hypothetical protein
MIRRPVVPDDPDDLDERDDRDEPDEPAALREPLERDDPEALRVLPAPLLFDLLLELPDDLLEPPRPLLPLIPLLPRFGI